MAASHPASDIAALWTRLPSAERRWLVEHVLALFPRDGTVAPAAKLPLRARLARYGLSSSHPALRVPEISSWTRAEAFLEPREAAWLAAAVRSRVVRAKPLQYILQWVPFMGVPVAARPPVLIPRWETEELCERAVQEVLLPALGDRMRDGGTLAVLDACTGSGCAALGIAHRLVQGTGAVGVGAGLREAEPPFRVLGFDVLPAAVRLARFNQRLHDDLRMDGVLACRAPLPVSFAQMDLFDDAAMSHLAGSADAIVSNPPYIPADRIPTLDASVRDWESRLALASAGKACDDPQGTRFHLRLLELAPMLLRPGDGAPNSLVMETDGDAQANVLIGAAEAMPAVRSAEAWRDAAGVRRFVYVRVRGAS
ncbi:S-adenosyl-L-methionine-dependent methyltransferase [Hyaloraphidium curvatum]|nr:S-adenosyl-L-methionine-dependent methyltransferase [Hyaloraphidium curvatum]